MYIRRYGVNDGLEDLKKTRKKVVILTKTMVFLVFSMPPLKIFHGVLSVIVCNSLNSSEFWFCTIETFSMGNRYELRKNIVTLHPRTRICCKVIILLYLGQPENYQKLCILKYTYSSSAFCSLLVTASSKIGNFRQQRLV